MTPLSIHCPVSRYFVSMASRSHLTLMLENHCVEVGSPKPSINSAVQGGLFASADEMIAKLVREYAQRSQPAPVQEAAAAPDPLMGIWREVSPRIRAEEISAPPFDLAALEAMMEQRADAGWRWDDKTQTLADPADRQFYFRIDPTTSCIALSDAPDRQCTGDPTPQEQP